MGSFRKTMAVMLVGLAFAAFQSGADAQTRRSSSDSQRTSSTTRTSTVRKSTDNKKTTTTTRRSAANNVNRPSGQSRPSMTKPAERPKPSGQTRPATVRPSGQTRPATVRPSGQTRPSVTRPSGQTRPSTTVTRPAGQTRPSSQTKPSVTKPSQDRPAQITRPGRPTGTVSNRPSQRPDKGPGIKPGPGPSKPVQIRPDHKPDRPRVHPRDRDFMKWDRPSYFWSSHNHCYGHRVRILPASRVIHHYHGHTYYCYNDIWYRPYGNYYVVCRPPYGTSLAAHIIADMTWNAVRLMYYSTVLNTYSQINENNAYIAQQNAVIAQNNATIAAQNAEIAQGQHLAQASYSLANQLGLIQSYAAAGTEYFYQDGVFYAKDSAGQYKVIVPPAGALVETLPEDFDMVTLSDGKEYYKVDDTIYRVTVSEGKPYFEVLGQLYS